MDYEEKLQLAYSLRSSDVQKATISEEYLSYLDKVTEEERMLDTREGKTHIYYIQAKNRTENCPVFINIHGGGFVNGYNQRDTIFAAKMADAIHGVAIDLDYKLAPEYPYPAAFHEAYDTVKWAFDHMKEIGGDSNRVILGGHSAGGNLVAAVTIKANQTKDFKARLQILDYPPTDVATDPVEKPGAVGNLISPQRFRDFNTLYTNDDPEVAHSPYVTMNLAPVEMLVGLPEALIITAGYDCLRFEGEEYAKLLADAGVKVTLKRFENSDHGFVIYCKGEWEEAQQLIVETMLKAISQ